MFKNHKYKTDKYAHFLTDITTYTPSKEAFEVGVRGHISNANMERLHTLHRFVKKTIKLKIFTYNLSALAVISSYFIYTCRKNHVCSQTDYFGPPCSHSCLPNIN